MYCVSMVKAVVFDELGYVVGEPDVPSDPIPQIVIWGRNTYIAGCPSEDGRPHFFLAEPFVIPETWEYPTL